MANEISEDELPKNIDGYTLRQGVFNNFAVFEYSKGAKFFRYLTDSPDFQKKSLDDLLYEVIASNVKDAYDQMLFRVKINEKIEIDDFRKYLVIKVDSTIRLNLPKKGYDFLMKTFDCYLIVDPISNARFYAVVTTNLKKDIPVLPKLMFELESSIMANPIISTLHKKNVESIKSAQFTGMVHLYTRKNVANEKEIIQPFKDFANWNVIVKDPNFLSKDGYLLPKQFINRYILCENKNDILLNSIGLPNTKFLRSSNSHSLFDEVRTQDIEGLRDRDFLSKSEVSRIKKEFSNYYILDFYCIENYLYHPDNIASLGISGFDKNRYIEEIIKQKNQVLEKTLKNLDKSRSYSELKFTGIANHKSAQFDIIGSLRSDKFKRFYKYFDMKSFNKSIIEHLNLSREMLASTSWFKKKFTEIVKDK